MRAFIRTVSTIILVVFTAFPAIARECPHLTTLIVGFPPGPLDAIGRHIVEQMKLKTGCSAIIVENLPGQNGVRGATELAKRGPNGSTLLLTPFSTMILPDVVGQDKIGFSAHRDFVPLALVAGDRLALVVSTAHPEMARVSSFAEYLTLMSKNPKLASYGTPGVNSGPHFFGVSISINARIEMLDVPYQGYGKLIPELLGGHLPAAIILSQDAHRHGEKVRVLAISGEKRWEKLPNVPTFSELGFGLTEHTYYGVFMHKGTPPETVAYYSKLIAEIANSDELRTRIEGQGSIPLTLPQREFEDFFTKYQSSWISNIPVIEILKKRYEGK